MIIDKGGDGEEECDMIRGGGYGPPIMIEPADHHKLYGQIKGSHGTSCLQRVIIFMHCS
jgi:hypothetical protein